MTLLYCKHCSSLYASLSVNIFYPITNDDEYNVMEVIEMT